MIDFTINKEEHIRLILDNFNFEKVHTVMDLLHWEWFASADGVPSIDELKRSATKLLYDVCDEWISASSGGFKANRRDDFLELYFVIGDYDSSMLNCGPIYEKRKKLKTRKKKIDTINITNNI